MAVAQAFNPSTREAKASLVVYRERESSRTVRITQRKSCLNTHTKNIPTHTHTQGKRKKEGEAGEGRDLTLRISFHNDWV